MITPFSRYLGQPHILIKILEQIPECFCLSIPIKKAEAIITMDQKTIMYQIIEWRGQPQTIRVDNGPEYVSGTLMAWAEKRNIRLQYIQPGKPQQNAYIERYNRTVRGEWLGQYIFETIEEAQDQATEWLWTYNNERPNMGIGGITPAMKLKTAA